MLLGYDGCTGRAGGIEPASNGTSSLVMTPSTARSMQKAILLLLSALALAAIVVTTAAGTPASRTRTARGASTRIGLEGGIFVALNRIRIRHGLVPLRLNATLGAASVQHSREMGMEGYFAHTSPAGTTLWERIVPMYDRGAHTSLAVGENLLWSSPRIRARAAMGLWMRSPEHRANILSPNWREIGVGAVRFASAPGVFGGLPVTILTTDFGVRG